MKNIPAKQNYLINNGRSILQYDDTIYYVFEENLYSMKKDKSEKKQISNLVGNTIFIDNSYIYSTKKEETYKINKKTYKTEKLFDGRIKYFDDKNKVIYYTNKEGLYKLFLNKNEKINLFKGNCQFLYYDKDTIYFSNEEENGNLILYSIKNNKTNLTEITTEKRDNYQEYLRIVNFSVRSDWIIYTVGNYEGTAQYFFGKLVHIKKDGSNKESFDSSNENFIIINHEIYYNYFSQGSQSKRFDKEGYYKISLDFSKQVYWEKDIGNIEYYDKENDWIYYSEHTNFLEESADLKRCRTNETESEIVVKVKDIFQEHNSKKFITYHNVNKIEDWIYFNCNTWAENKNGGWRPQLKNSQYYRIKTDKTNLELIQEITYE